MSTRRDNTGNSSIYTIALDVLRNDIRDIVFSKIRRFGTKATFVFPILYHNFNTPFTPDVLKSYKITQFSTADEIMAWASAYIELMSTTGPDTNSSAITSRFLTSIQTDLAPYREALKGTSTSDIAARIDAMYPNGVSIPQDVVTGNTAGNIFTNAIIKACINVETKSPVNVNSDVIMTAIENATQDLLQLQINKFFGGASTGGFDHYTRTFQAPLADLKQQIFGILPTMFKQSPPKDLREYFDVTYSVILAWWIKYYQTLSNTPFIEADVLLAVIYFTTPLTIYRYIASFSVREQYPNYQKNNSFYDVMYAEYTLQMTFRELLSVLKNTEMNPAAGFAYGGPAINFASGTTVSSILESIQGSIDSSIQDKILRVGSKDNFYKSFKMISDKSAQNQATADNLDNVNQNFEWRRANLGIMLTNTAVMELLAKSNSVVFKVWVFVLVLVVVVGLLLLIRGKTSLALMYCAVLMLILMVIAMIHGIMQMYQYMY